MGLGQDFPPPAHPCCGMRPWGAQTQVATSSPSARPPGEKSAQGIGSRLIPAWGEGARPPRPPARKGKAVQLGKSLGFSVRGAAGKERGVRGTPGSAAGTATPTPPVPVTTTSCPLSSSSDPPQHRQLSGSRHRQERGCSLPSKQFADCWFKRFGALPSLTRGDFVFANSF